MEPITILRQLNRREFLKAGGMTALGVALSGCAKNPVTGHSQFMLVSEQEEIAMDKQASPQQLSSDYGLIQDTELNEYVSSVGTSLSDESHRPDMPYSYQVVNANYINAYAFPGGTIACTRGIMLGLDNEAELAALLGHEIGHVNARHTASRMSSQKLLAPVAVGAGVTVGAIFGGKWGALAGGVSGLGMGVLLASYSRDDERQADSLGMEYMVDGGYNPDGMVGLMDMLNDQHSAQPSTMQVMFSTHPMSSERLATAREQAYKKYAGASEYSIYRERYMDNTASLRAIAPAVKNLQQAESLLAQKKYVEAEQQCAAALKIAPQDYCGLMLMSKCKIAQGKYDAALPFTAKAREVYPAEAQAMQFNGLLNAQSKNFSAAFADFDAYDKALPGNPYIAFYKGYSQEGMGNKQEAAQEYVRFLRKVNKGDQAKYAYSRLVEWGYVKSESKPAGNPLPWLA